MGKQIGRPRIENLQRRQVITLSLSPVCIVKMVTIAKWKGIANGRLVEELIDEKHKELSKLWDGPTPPSNESILAKITQVPAYLDLSK